jgi:hypothetical protein
LVALKNSNVNESPAIGFVMLTEPPVDESTDWVLVVVFVTTTEVGSDESGRPATTTVAVEVPTFVGIVKPTV